MFRLETITPPTPPLTAEEVRRNIGVTGTHDDPRITSLIAAAVAYVENDADKAFGPQVLAAHFDSFHTCGRRSVGLELPRGPATSIVAVTYRDADGVTSPLDEAAFYLEDGSDPGTLFPADLWPATGLHRNTVRVQYQAGRGWPDDVLQAIHLLVGFWYDHPSAAASDLTEVPFGVDAILRSYRRVFL